MKRIILLFFYLSFKFSFSQSIYAKYCPVNISRPYFLSNGMSYQFQNLYDSGTTSMNILKNDSNGNVVWNRSFYELNYEINVQFFLTLPDGGFAFIGGQVKLPDRFEFLLRGDSLGNVLWSKRICNLVDQATVSIVRTYDDGFLVALKDIPFSSQSFLLSIDNSGNLEYYKRIYPDSFVIDDIKQLPDSNFLISGNQQIPNYINNITFAKINKQGNVLSAQGIGDSYDETHFSDLVLTSDSGFAIYGLLTHGNAQRAIFKFNSYANLLWARTLFPITSGFSEPINYLIETADKSLIVSYEYPYSPIKSYLLKLDSSGNMLWSKKYEGFLRSGIAEDPGHGINFTFYPNSIDGTCIMRIDSAGNAPCADSIGIYSDSIFFPSQFNRTLTDSNYTKVLTDFLVSDSLGINIVFDYCQVIHVDELIPNDNSMFNLFPNPTNGYLTLSSPQCVIASIAIYNLIGENFLTLKNCDQSKQEEMIIDVSKIPSGIYFIKIESEKGTSVQKFIKQ